MKLEIECKTCGKRYSRYPSQAGPYCSRKCCATVGNEARVKMMHATRVERFWARVKKTDGCWLWQGATSDYGYGILKLDGKTTQAHVVAWEFTHGPVPRGLCVLHKCDNPPCVKEDHLFLGTRTDNNHDKVNKGRQPRHCGELNPNVRLNKEDVEEIRSRYAKGNIRQVDLGNAFGISQTHVSAIVRGKLWTR